MAADFAERKEHIVPAHPFSDDIISVSRKLAERFCCDTEHIHQVEIAALKLFDALRKSQSPDQEGSFTSSDSSDTSQLWQFSQLK